MKCKVRAECNCRNRKFRLLYYISALTKPPRSPSLYWDHFYTRRAREGTFPAVMSNIARPPCYSPRLSDQSC